MLDLSVVGLISQLPTPPLHMEKRFPSLSVYGIRRHTPPGSTGRANVYQAASVPGALAAANGGNQFHWICLYKGKSTRSFQWNIGFSDKISLKPSQWWSKIWINLIFLQGSALDVLLQSPLSSEAYKTKGVCTINCGAQNPPVPACLHVFEKWWHPGANMEVSCNRGTPIIQK